MNKRITPKDKANIKNGMRRAFARSELHCRVIEASIIRHSDPKRPKVQVWCRCNVCKKPEAKSYMVVDHIVPFVPIGSAFSEMSLDDAEGRLWCELNNLQSCCPACHRLKSAREAAERKQKRGRK